MSERVSRPVTLGEMGELVRAAFEEGYLQGFYHPKGERVMVSRERIAKAFWDRIEHNMRAKWEGGQ